MESTSGTISANSAQYEQPSVSQYLAGRNLAAFVVRELTAAGSDKCSIEAAHRPGSAQCSALAKAIEMLRTAPPSVVAGFAALMTDMIGCDARPSIDYYESLTAYELGLSVVDQPPASH